MWRRPDNLRRQMSKRGAAIRAMGGGPAAVGISIFLAWQFGLALWRLVDRTGEMNSKFSRLAVEEYWLFLVGQNLLMLVAYGLVGLVGWLILLPVIAQIPRRPRYFNLLVLGAGWLGAVVLHSYWMLRLVHSRPYFIKDGSLGVWYQKALNFPPIAWQPAIHVAFFEVLPWLVAVAVAVWWWRRLGGNRALALALLGTVVICFAALSWSHARRPIAILDQPSDQPLNVIIIGSDSLRGDRLGYAGYRPQRSDGAAAAGVSPFIDEWSRGASVFNRCMTPIGSTLESSISLMTSTYPIDHGIRQMFATRQEIEDMEARTTPIAELFAEQGYATAAIGDWCAGFYEVTQLGFEDVDVSSFDSFRIYMSQAVTIAHFVVPLYFDNPLGYALFPQIRSFAQFVTPEVVTKRVEERIANQAKTDRPFFWHIFYSCNHLPFRSAEPYSGMFTDPDYRGPNATGVDFDIDSFIGSTDLEDKWSALPPHEVAQIRALYDGCTRQFDACFARIVGALERQGLADKTVVVLTADHGDDLYGPGVTLGHGLSFNGSDPSFHVPLAIHVPGRAGRVSTSQVRTLDIAPTLAKITGLEVPPSWRGESLLSRKNDDSLVIDRPFYGETQFPFIQFRVGDAHRPPLPAMDEMTFIDEGFNYQFVLKSEFKQRLIAAKQRCLRTRDWKLTLTPTVSGEPHLELFHTSLDPSCRENRARQRPEVVAAMDQALAEWITSGAETSIETIFPDGEPKESNHAVDF